MFFVFLGIAVALLILAIYVKAGYIIFNKGKNNGKD